MLKRYITLFILLLIVSNLTWFYFASKQEVILKKEIINLEKQLSEFQAHNNPININGEVQNISYVKKLYGLIQFVYEQDSKRMIDIDYINYFRGDEAKKEMVKDGYCETAKICEPEDGIYVRNTDEAIDQLELAYDAEYYVLTYKMLEKAEKPIPEIVTYSEFVDLINKNNYLKTVPFYIITTNDVVSEMKQMFLP